MSSRLITWIMFWTVIAAGAITTVVWFLLKRDPEPLLGIYSQPGKWFLLKKLLFVLMLKLRKRQAKKEAIVNENASGYGFKSRSSVDEMECPQQLCSSDMAVDCMYFNGLDAAGTFVIFRIARRHDRKAEIWLSINVPGVGFFQSPVHPDTNVYNVDSDIYSAGGLKFECIEPMKRWRVTFNGLLRKGMSSEWSDGNFETVHVKVSMNWCAFTDPFDFDTDIHPGCLAEAIAREKWSRDYFDRLKQSHQTHYEQWGELWGTFNAEGYPEKVLRVRGYRDHSYGVRDWYTFHRYAINFAYLEDGTTFHVNSVSLPGTLSLLQCGYFSLPNARLFPVTWTDMNFLELGEDGTPPKRYEFNFVADGKNYHVTVVPHTVFLYYVHEDWRSVVHEQVSHFEVNGVKGYGIFEFLYRRKTRGSPVTPERILSRLIEMPVTSTDALTLPFTAAECTSSRLVGGKGCQLALLTQLKSKDFNVPPGFCLTIRAFELHVENNKQLQEAVDRLQEISSTRPGELQSACTAVVSLFQSATLSAEIRNALTATLSDVFGPNFATVSLAVRSSATGEDGSELSAAGQMDTLLGVCGCDQIYKAIAQCWASQFALPAVSYRRQHGQSIRLSAGVVVQQMVPAAAAGVLFTHHPVSGNPGVMMLNANFGLGESVVSGESEPDEVTISRTWNNQLAIKSKVLGSKKTQLKLTDDGHTKEVSGTDTDSKQCCLSDEAALKLAAIGVELEKRFAGPRDIEFAIDSNGAIHLLQARPITSLDLETEYDLLHEFDSALSTDKEYLTTANIQEMMPGAMTPLTISVFLAACDYAGQAARVDIGVQDRFHYPQKFSPCFYNRGFLSMSLIFADNGLSALVCCVTGQCDLHCSLGDKRTAELALLGEVSDQYSMQDVESFNGRFPLIRRLYCGYRLFRRLRAGDSESDHWAAFAKKFEIVDDPNCSVHEIYNKIDRDLHIYGEVFDYHMKTSGTSSMWANALMVVLAKNKPEWTLEHFSDLAYLLGKCKDVYSADVPSALQSLAGVLADSSYKDNFVNLLPDEAATWLQSSESGKAGVEFSQFLRRHGHRCIREAELREKPWSTEPTKVVKVLQSMVKVYTKTDRQSDSRDLATVDGVKTPTNAVERAIMRWILPKAHKGVGSREFSKSITMKIKEEIRRSYEILAKKMLAENRLPDEDLIFFFTHKEIGQLLKNRSGRLVSKAQKRRQMLPDLMKLQFPRIIFGHPEPIEAGGRESESTSTSLKVKGCPVSQGVVKGKARVVTSIEAAAEIQVGEILIVPFTDVGWSPYFPLIAGLVTEIGGLLSHGAVVAREYGLPCVVKVSEATVLFKTGDTVLLNGTAGILEKLNVVSDGKE